MSPKDWQTVKSYFLRLLAIPCFRCRRMLKNYVALIKGADCTKTKIWFALVLFSL